MKIFVINPGSTSTKLALYENDKPVWVGGAHHPLYISKIRMTIWASSSQITNFLFSTL